VTPLAEFVRGIIRDREFGPEAVHLEEIPAREAVHGPLPPGLHPAVTAGLAGLGIHRLYRHQSLAVAAALEGRDVVVVTPTASGKTLCYNLPVISRCLGNPGARALYLFPIKALEQDQLQGFRELAASCGAAGRVTAEIYDGDTPAHRREGIRRDPPSVLITNPDMLHLSLLAHHPKWEAFWRSLSTVVLDEVHTYRGVFGSHVAHVLRRLFRVAALYGSRPGVVACSGTIANPGQLTRRLTSREVTVVDESGAPEAGRRFLFLNPRILSPSTVASSLLARSVSSGLATIVFTKARKMTELIHAWTLRHRPDLRHVISAYRAGYLPEERREIEARLFDGSLKGVVSTSALEMGIDIGALDVCLLVGYPGAVTTTWQRGGRVGRQDRESLIVLIAQQDALDQYFMKHPRAFFDSGFEPATIDPGNLPILKSHLLSAAAEIPLTADDPWYFPAGSPPAGEEDEPPLRADEAVRQLEREGKLLLALDDRSWHAAPRNPQREISLRGIGQAAAILEEAGPPDDARDRRPERGQAAVHRPPRVIGSLDGHRLHAEGHPGAIYLHRAAQYEMVRLDLERRNVFARKVTANYYTIPLREKETEILETRTSRPVKNFVARLGTLKVTERVTGYEKKRLGSGERLSVHELDLPPTTFETVGFWLEMDDFVPRTVQGLGLNYMGGIHAVEHAAISLFPLFALCERDDVGGISIPLHPQVGKGAIFVYDGYPGGVGLAERSFARLEELLAATLELIARCECEAGCPACIYSSRCGNGNVPLDKRAAAAVLSLLLDRPESREWRESAPVPDGEPEDLAPLGEAPPEPPPPAPGPRVVVVDVETRRGADEVGGWGNIHLMGLALAVVWDSLSGEFTTYHEDQAPALLRHLALADLVVGFNLLGFDYRVLSAYDDGTIPRLRTFDILLDIRKRLSWRLSLGHLAGETLGAAKSADGLQSLEWVREGRLDLVEEYCREDVRITRDLFRHGLEKGWLRFLTKDGRPRQLTVDWDLAELAGK
jgi:DEAD/DEAH box helicase domain-containing protein